MSSGEEDNDDMWEECRDEANQDDSAPAICLFCNDIGSDAEEVFHHCDKVHGFNLAAMKKKHGNQYCLFQG